MTQRSAERWNTGKRGARQRKAFIFALRLGEQISVAPKTPGTLMALNAANRGDWSCIGLANMLCRTCGRDWQGTKIPYDRKRHPRLSSSFRRGAMKWAENQPVNF